VIAREAVELHSMFKDFNTLVADQSEGITNAEKHVEATQDKVADGVKHLDKVGVGVCCGCACVGVCVMCVCAVCVLCVCVYV